MTDNWTARLSEYLDETLAPTERQALAAHLTGCAECTATLAELRRVVARAESLEDRPPRADLWPAVEAGKLALPIDKTFALDQVAEALSMMRANQHFGKIVLTM